MKNNMLKISLICNLILFLVLSMIVIKTNLISSVLANKEYSNPQFEQMLTSFESVETQQADIVFLGDSITENGLWYELLPNVSLVNRGIGSDTTLGVLNRTDNIIKLNPKKIFIMIGINDLSLKESKIVDNYNNIINTFQEKLPNTKIYIQSILPVQNGKSKISNNEIDDLNSEISKLANGKNIIYVDINSKLKSSDGGLNPNYTVDGLHLKGEAYTIWVKEIQQYIN